jgi:hypothetical protein
MSWPARFLLILAVIGLVLALVFYGTRQDLDDTQRSICEQVADYPGCD